MNDNQIESMLNGHEWPDMPADTRARIDNAIRTFGRPARSWKPALAAGLLVGAIVGGGGVHLLRAPASIDNTPTSATREDAVPASYDPRAPIRLAINTAVFPEAPVQRISIADRYRWLPAETD